MAVFDFKQADKDLYRPPAHFTQVVVPPQWFIMIDGRGDPNTSPDYEAALGALYGASYGLKFGTKGDPGGQDYRVGPLEGLWWTDDESAFDRSAKSEWNWTMMIRVPDWIAPGRVRDLLDATAEKKGNALIAKLRHEQLDERTCVQIMHTGPYDDEAPILRELHHDYLPAHGLVETGHHHEIYLGDPRRSAPERLKTVLRQPVRER